MIDIAFHGQVLFPWCSSSAAADEMMISLTT
jgi:hypothetical protein